MYTIVLSDGTRIENVDLNMNTWESKQKITEDVFEGKLDNVAYITPDGDTVELGECNLVYCGERDKIWRFCLNPITDAEKVARALAQQRADLDYIMIMEDL